MNRTLWLLLTFWGSTQLMAQTVSLSPLVGPTIDRAEYQYYGLDRQLPYEPSAMDSLQFTVRKLEGGILYFAQWYLPQGDTPARRLSESEWQALQQRIEARGEKLLQTWQKLAGRFSAEDTPRVWLQTLSGQRLTGQVVAMNAQRMTLRNDLGTFDFRLEDLASLEIRSSTAPTPGSHRFAFPNPSSTRYLFAPSAIPLREGEHYYQNVMLTVSSVNWGLTDRLALSAGTELLSLLFTAFMDGDVFVPAFANLKYATPVRDNFYLGGGALMVGGLVDQGAAGAGLGYGVATWGDLEHNVTLGAGLASGGSWNGAWRPGLGLRPVLSVNGMTRLSDRIALVSENWYFPPALAGTGDQYFDPSQLLILSGGIRILTPDISFDLSLLGITTGSPSYDYDPATQSFSIYEGYSWYWIPLPLPFLGLVYRFGDY